MEAAHLSLVDLRKQQPQNAFLTECVNWGSFYVTRHTLHATRHTSPYLPSSNRPRPLFPPRHLLAAAALQLHRRFQGNAARSEPRQAGAYISYVKHFTSQIEHRMLHETRDT